MHDNTNLEEFSKVGKGPGLVGENKVTIALNVHGVVQHNLLGLVVFIDELGLDVLDVFAVVVNVLLGGLAVLEDVVVVSMVNNENTSGLQHVIHVLDAGLVVPGKGVDK